MIGDHIECSDFPKVGTRLTYGEAIPAYDRFERSMLEKVYGAELLPAVGLYDLLWQLESLAQKFGIESKEAFPRLKREIRAFSSERTALANGVNGERFYLLQDESALRQHDETHLFRVGTDGSKLVGDLDEALELLSKESAKTDACADTYSIDRSERDSDGLGKDPFMKWAGIGFCVMMACFGISMLVHSVFQIGFCSKRFL